MQAGHFHNSSLEISFQKLSKSLVMNAWIIVLVARLWPVCAVVQAGHNLGTDDVCLQMLR